MPLGPAQQYLAQYNGFVLPGYVQSESFDSQMNIASHYGAYIDGSPSEETGLANKVLPLRLKVWETDYLTCKEQVQYAATILRSKRNGFATLRVQYPDKHYDAMVKSITTSKEAGTSVRTLEYQVEFECKPWLIGEVQHTLTLGWANSGELTTLQVGRTISNGGWTPATVTYTGGGATGINGYTEDSQLVGAFVVSEAVSGLIVDTEAFTATESAVNANAKMFTTDYRLYVGPGTTTFYTTGSDVTITYYDRWYI